MRQMSFAGSSKGGTYGDVVEDLDRSTGAIMQALSRLGLRGQLPWSWCDQRQWRRLQRQCGRAAAAASRRFWRAGRTRTHDRALAWADSSRAW